MLYRYSALGGEFLRHAYRLVKEFIVDISCRIRVSWVRFMYTVVMCMLVIVHVHGSAHCSGCVVNSISAKTAC